MKYAYVVDGQVRELIEDMVDGVALCDRYHPDFLAALLPVPSGIDVTEGDFVVDGQFSKAAADTRTEQELAAAARGQRTVMLSATDWTQLPDVPQETSAKWAVYRQALRDVPAQKGFPGRVEWPEPPK